MTALRRLHRAGAEQPRLWLDWQTGFGVDPAGRSVAIGPERTVAAVCASAHLLGARVVVYCGERPGGDAGGFSRWRTPHDADDWQARPEGHYLKDLQVPVLRYQRRALPAVPVDIRSSGEWFGDHNQVGPAAAAAALDLTRGVLADRFYGARLWASPQATGTDLLLRSLPEGRTWDPLPAEVADQVRATATQGRTETFAHPGELAALVEYDGRFMYAALCADLPEGPAVIGEGWPDPERLGYLHGTEPAMVRGRFLVEWRPPAGWAHVGVLPHLGAGGWSWPTDRRWRKGWVDGAELWVALRWGWEVKCRRHLCWGRSTRRGPLAVWADHLVGARSQLQLLGDDEVPTAAAAAVRAITLTTIGVLHGRGHAVTRTAPVDQPLPRGRLDRLHTQGDQYVWHDDDGPARPQFAHPEWSAAIWARCRGRMLDGPAVAGVRTGALHVPPSTLVAFSVDALYLSVDPDWPDDGRAGRLRRKAFHPGPHPAPQDRAGLLSLLRDQRKEPAL